MNEHLLFANITLLANKLICFLNRKYGSCIQETVIDFHVTMKLGRGVKTTEGVTMKLGGGVKTAIYP